MNRLSSEAAERIRARAKALLDGPNDLAADRERNAGLEERISAYQETLWFFETWVAWLEARLRLAGIDPTDLWDDPQQRRVPLNE